MIATEWLGELARRVEICLPQVEVFRAADDTITVALGNRVVTAHDDGGLMWLAPCFLRQVVL